MLLVRPGAPRSLWEQHCADPAAAEIDAAAVATVLRRFEDHQSGGRTGDATDADAQLVREVLDGGRGADADTLERFIAAFGLGPRHADQLRALLRGSDSVRVISGHALAELHRQAGPPEHTTLAVHEMHTLGPDGVPVEHQTIQVIESTVEECRAYPVRFDTDELVVEVVRGGRVGDLFRLSDTLYGVDIDLDRPLRRGESTLMHYRLSFGYRTAPPPEFRRGVLGTMKDVTLWVQFHPGRLPARVWLGRWDRLDHATVIEEQQVELDNEYSVQARYDQVEDAIVGFHWAWD